MRKVIGFLVVSLMLVSSVPMMAASPQSNRKKSSTRSSTTVPLQKMSDGYYDVVGHTYTTTEFGMKFTIKFLKNDIAELTKTIKGKPDTIRVSYSYLGRGLYSVYRRELFNDPNTLYLEVSDDGKKLFAREDPPYDNDPLTFELVK